ncbi:hypothetical protein A6M14_12645 [Acinetobacter sp. Ac_877]|uniref:hypothetical protein n=1 Tax=Acinetobacter portensis TaxID=1839785 RepID=UPI00128DCD33|nr:hypothetical protein [Acinetobacter portensis]MPW42517.1 hypothetical protein [Acinetobacter portensis]
MKLNKTILGLAVLSLSTFTMAAPMPHTITVEDKAVVPVLKTEVIRKVAGQNATRHVEATIFEVTNKGKDVIAREVEFNDDQQQFSDKQLSIPVIKKGGVIVPTSKIELNKTLKQDGKIISQTKNIDAEGIEFKKDQLQPVKRTLKLNEANGVDTNKKVSHVVTTENGEKTRDLLIINENP